MKRPALALATAAVPVAAALTLVGLSAPALAQSSGSSFTAQLSGEVEVPTGDPDGTGSFSMTVRDGQVCFTVSMSGVAPVTAGHIHRGGEGVAGPVVVPLLEDEQGLPTEQQFNSEQRCVEADAAVVEEIRSNPGGFYANFHNAEFPGGAVRGQLTAGSLPFTGTSTTELALAGTVLVAAGGVLVGAARRRRAVQA